VTAPTFKAYRDVVYTLIHEHNGIVLDSPGNNLLAEFVSVADAVEKGKRPPISQIRRGTP
jgi:adenylate cyclase